MSKLTEKQAEYAEAREELRKAKASFAKHAAMLDVEERERAAMAKKHAEKRAELEAQLAEEQAVEELQLKAYYDEHRGAQLEARRTIERRRKQLVALAAEIPKLLHADLAGMMGVAPQEAVDEAVDKMQQRIEGNGNVQVGGDVHVSE